MNRRVSASARRYSGHFLKRWMMLAKYKAWLVINLSTAGRLVRRFKRPTLTTKRLLLRRGRQRVTTCLALFTLAAACPGCVPGHTHTREIYYEIHGISEPRLSPDSTQAAYCLPVEYMRLPIGIFREPAGGTPAVLGGRVEVYVYDVRTRRPPRLVFTKNAVNVESNRCAWTD